MFESYRDDIQAYLQTKLAGNGANVPALPLSIQLHIADTRLVAIAKQGFPKLPLPIRNVLMAVVEFEREETKCIESYTHHNLSVMIASLDTLISNVSSRIDNLKNYQDSLIKDLLPLWHEDIKSLDVQSLRDMVPRAPFTDPWNEIEVLFHAASTYGIRITKSLVLEPADVNLSSVEARLALSRQYREKANALSNGLTNTAALGELKVDFEEPVARPSKVQTSKENTEALELAIKVRSQAARLWHPYRKTIAHALSGRKDLVEVSGAIKDVIVGSKAIPKLSKESLSEELKFAVASFPCDQSMLRTCLTASSDGVKLAHTRKMMEIKNECTRQIQIRLAQLGELFDSLHEALAAKTFA